MNKLFLLFFVMATSLFSCTQDQHKRILVEPPLENIAKQLALLEAGDTLVLKAGTYYGTLAIDNINGASNKPIVIMGESSDPHQYPIIDGQEKPAMGLSNSGVRALKSSWIELRNIKFQNCYTNVIFLENCQNISVISCDIEGGKMAVYGKGTETHSILIENCHWEQDERIWTHAEDYSWTEVHHGVHEYYNGSLFQGKDIAGNVVIRNNTLKNVYNAFRITPVNGRNRIEGTSINYDIYNNFIENSADNVLEPEVHVENVWFYYNKMKNGHAFISITEVQGGPIYLFGNRGWSTPDCEDGWTIFKLSSNEDNLQGLDEELYIFNNSFYVDYNAHGRNANWRNTNIKQFNNAFYTENQDEYGIFVWNDGYYFDHDCSNIPFPQVVKDNNAEKNSIIADPLFVDGSNGDFTLQGNSPCKDAGTNYANILNSYKGKAPAIGAMEDGKLIDGPAFKHRASTFYQESPRVVKYKYYDKTLELWFSSPLDPLSIKHNYFNLLANGKVINVTSATLDKEGYKLLLDCKTTVNENPHILVDSRVSGRNGLGITKWASEITMSIK